MEDIIIAECDSVWKYTILVSPLSIMQNNSTAPQTTASEMTIKFNNSLKQFQQEPRGNIQNQFSPKHSLYSSMRIRMLPNQQHESITPMPSNQTEINKKFRHNKCQFQYGSMTSNCVSRNKKPAAA